LLRDAAGYLRYVQRSRPREITYLSCPRCGVAVLKGSPENGSPLCPDCREADEAVVMMDLITVPLGAPGRLPTSGGGGSGRPK
jgi:hypothetical protein